MLLYTYISRFSANPHYQQQLYLRPSFIAFFNFLHKWPTFAFTSESGYTLGFQRKIAHKGTHGKTVAFPPSDTAGLCAASEIALSAAFVTLDSAMLLYTYISRFSVNPLSAEEKKSDKASAINFISQPLFIAFFSLAHKRPTFAFTGESGYTLGFGEGSHTAAYTPKQGPPLPRPQRGLVLPVKLLCMPYL